MRIDDPILDSLAARLPAARVEVADLALPLPLVSATLVRGDFFLA